METTYLQKIRSFYPDAQYANALGEMLIGFIRNRGYKPGQVMTANSLCGDDIIAMQYPQSGRDLLGPFNMGGLNGFPFTGLTGVSAFSHHMPEQGALLIVYAPHIGIPVVGNPGFVKRRGQPRISECCGAAIKGLRALGLMPGGEAAVQSVPEALDEQYAYILSLFRRHESEIRRNPENPILPATEVMYRAVDERLQLLINMRRADFKGKELFLAGGIFINTDDGHPACAVNRRLVCMNLETGETTEQLAEYQTYLRKTPIVETESGY